MVLPVLFAARMNLFDTADGVFMSLSVVVALVVGVIVLVSVLVDKLEIDPGPLATMGSLELNYVGYIVVRLFIVTWVIAASVWKFGRIE